MPKKDTTRGKATERMAATWFRDNGFPGCERVVRTGYRGTARQLADEGDLDLCPGAIAQIKSLRPANRAERAVPTWVADTELQRRAAHADIALLVVRRDGTSDVGEWWTWLTLVAVEALRTGDTLRLDDPDTWTVEDVTPVRLQVTDAARLLRRAGYGTPIDDTEQLLAQADAAERATARDEAEFWQAEAEAAS